MPLVAFWVAHRVAGIVPGVLAASGAAAGLLVWRRRVGGRASAAALSASLVVLSAAVGLVARDEVVYLAQGVVTTAVIGLAFALSAATGRPLAGVLAVDLFALPGEVWRERPFVGTFRVISCAWAGFELVSAGARAVLLASTDLYAAVSAALGTAGTLALFWWSVRYASNRLSLSATD